MYWKQTLCFFKKKVAEISIFDTVLRSNSNIKISGGWMPFSLSTSPLENPNYLSRKELSALQDCQRLIRIENVGNMPRCRISDEFSTKHYRYLLRAYRRYEDSEPFSRWQHA